MNHQRDRDDRDNRRFDRPAPPGLGSEAVLGKVTTVGTTTAGKFLKFNPVVGKGGETESGTPTLTVDTTRTVIGELVQGSAAQNDILMFRWADWRWVTDKGVSVSCGFVLSAKGCGTNTIPGVVITLSQGGSTVATGTTTGRVKQVNMTATGTGYTSVPTVGFAGGGGGTGAAGTPDMRPITITRTSGGSGYTNGSYTNGTFTGGGGSGATFNYTVTGGVVQTTLTITGGGTGYTSPPTPVFNAGPGTGAAAATTLGVRIVTMTNGGSGYTSNPTVSFTGGGGSAAAATSTIEYAYRFVVPSGTYDFTATTTASSGFQSASGTVTLTCPGGGGDGGAQITLTIDPDYVCPHCCTNALPKNWDIEDDFGIHHLSYANDSFTGFSNDAWTGDYTIVGTPSANNSCVISPNTPIRYVLRLICVGITHGWQLAVYTWAPTNGGGCGGGAVWGNVVGTQGSFFLSPFLAVDCAATTLTFDVPTTAPGGGGSIVATAVGV